MQCFLGTRISVANLNSSCVQAMKDDPPLTKIVSIRISTEQFHHATRRSSTSENRFQIDSITINQPEVPSIKINKTGTHSITSQIDHLFVIFRFSLFFSPLPRGSFPVLNAHHPCSFLCTVPHNFARSSIPFRRIVCQCRYPACVCVCASNHNNIICKH